MRWEYRVIAKELDGKESFGIHEVYYEEDNIVSWTDEPVTPFGEACQEVRKNYELMRSALFRPVLRLQFSDGKSCLKQEEPEAVALDEYFCHEALDRAAVFTEQFETQVSSHPQIELNPDLRAQAEEILDLLSNLYQKIGNLKYDKS